MRFWQRLFGGAPPTDARALHLYVRCRRCGAPVHVRIDLHNDLSGDDEEGYFVRKEIMDDRCFRLMQAELRFDARRRELERSIEGGEFISADEYERLRAARSGPSDRAR
ncbi:hypothetical protein [Kallotenue papyrolyticum]|uniref:hypothetical protein n=1 Tax=Kallotenue papyrolyticum TaxID=1325125 RepID=UPI0004786125|nr:hypothetical protein [Kallotenue papyrolyticum]